MATITMLDIAKRNGSDKAVGLIEEVQGVFPEIVYGDARTIKGTGYKTLVRTDWPTAGFRNANEGAATVKSTYENKSVETFTMDVPVEVDKAVADRDEEGPEAMLADEASGVMFGVMRSICSQMYYGTATTVATSTAASPTKGFPGLVQMVDSTMVYDATGTGSARSSVWGVRYGRKLLRWVWGADGQMEPGDVVIRTKDDGSSNPYDVYRIPMLLYPGLQMHNKYAVGRLKNLTAAVPLTDDLLSELYYLFPPGMKPDIYFMSSRSLKQLQTSRTATNPTGQPAPIPTISAEGVPIYVTTSIVDTEAA